MCSDKVKAYVYDRLIAHLSKQEDSRRREQMRARIALRTINGWLREGLKKYGER